MSNFCNSLQHQPIQGEDRVGLQGSSRHLVVTGARSVLQHQTKEVPMQLLYEYSSALSLLSVSIHGSVSDDALSAIHLQTRVITSQLQVDCGIFDLSGADLSAIASETIRAFASFPPMLPVSARRIVVAPPAYQYGMVRMYEMAASRTIEICRSIQEAYAVLGIHVSPSFQTVTLDAEGRVVLGSRPERKAG